jgi:PAP2 superfamily
MTLSRFPSSRLSRRAVVGAGIAGTALFPLRVPDSVAPVFDLPPAGAAPMGADPADELVRWKMWLLTSPNELRPPAPGTPTDAEIEEIIGYLESPSDEMTAAVKKWGTSIATIPWSTTANAALTEFKMAGMRQCRALALVHTAMHDAAVAAWDAQLAYNRPSPAATDDRIVSAAGTTTAPSYPSQHAAVAAAAATVLAYLLPDAAPDRFADLAQEAAMSRVWAGAAFPSDVQAGLALGKAVGERAVARGKSDGSDTKFDLAKMPTGPGFWQRTPPAQADPLEPLGGTWKAWLLESNDQFRPVAPPDYDSPAWHSELLAVQQIVKQRTLAEMADAAWWQSAAFQNFYDWSAQLLARHGLDTPHAARVLAYQAVSEADAVTAVWDAKYTWWTERPITADPEIVTAFPTPPYPAYPSGYSAVAGAFSQMGGLFFPDAAGQLDELGWRATRSRAWAGIHYPIDNEVGFTMGRRVARLAALRAMEEGALPG